MDRIYLLSATLLIGFSFYGWGSILRKTVAPDLPRGFNIIAGLALLNVIGGLVVWAGLFSRWVVYLLWAVGLILALFDLRKVLSSVKLRRISGDYHSESMLNWIPWLFMISIGLVQFEAFHHSIVFNLHDDFEKYLKYPVQLLEVGHLRTGFFDTLGSEALGSQSMFQAFLITFIPLDGVMLFDSVICMVASMIALISLTIPHRGGWLIALLGCLAMTAIDPLLVNTSAIYSGVSGFSLLFWLICRDLDGESSRSNSVVLMIALTIALLVSLKTTLALMVPVFFLTWIFTRLLSRSWKTTLLDGLKVVLLSIVFVSPWFFVHLPKYVGVFNGASAVDTAFESLTRELIPPKGMGLLSFEPFFYGFHMSVGFVTCSVFLLFLFSVFLFFRLWRGNTFASLGSITCLAGVVVTYLVTMMIFSPATLGPIHSLRYVIPSLIAAIIPLSIFLKEAENSRTSDSVAVRATHIGGLGCMLVVVLVFAPSLVTRLNHAITGKSMISIGFFDKAEYHYYCRQMLSEKGKRYFEGLQRLIPEKATTLVWCIGAFQLDYRRNPILGVDPAGLATPWLDFPFEAEIDDGIQCFKTHSVEYILWQYDGVGVRGMDSRLVPSILHGYPREAKIAWRTKAFVEFLTELASSDQVEKLYDADGFVVMRLK